MAYAASEFAEPTKRVRRSIAKLSCGQALSSRLTPAAIRPNERRDSAFRAAANAVSAATVTPGASPRAFSAALSRSSASLSLSGLLSAIHQTFCPFLRVNSTVSPQPKKAMNSNSAERRSSSSAVRKGSSPGLLTPPARAPFNPSDRVRPRADRSLLPLRSRANASPFSTTSIAMFVPLRKASTVCGRQPVRNGVAAFAAGGSLWVGGNRANARHLSEADR